MKEAVKLALLQFGLSIGLLVLEYVIRPEAYPGETLLVVWFYVFDLLIGLALLPIFSLLMMRIVFRKRIGYILSYFLFILCIINIVPFLSGHIFYMARLVGLVFRKTDKQLMSVFELANPVLSFIIAYFLLRKSKLWYHRYPLACRLNNSA